jgi:hypothetical protein
MLVLFADNNGSQEYRVAKRLMKVNDKPRRLKISTPFCIGSAMMAKTLIITWTDERGMKKHT